MGGDDPVGNRSSFLRPIGHKIYVPMDATFQRPQRYQAELDEDVKKHGLPPRYEPSSVDRPTVNTITNWF